MNKYTKPTLQKLENLFKELDYTVRYEKGTFNSGYCIVEDRRIVVMNRFFDTDARVGVLLDILDSLQPDETILTEKSRTLLKTLIRDRSASDPIHI
jgi:hypothetical protein